MAAAQRAILEWVDTIIAPAAPATTEAAPGAVAAPPEKK